ncbi:MAG: hypothetical protein R2851_02900 [Caldilineaceae bacterium]
MLIIEKDHLVLQGMLEQRISQLRGYEVWCGIKRKRGVGAPGGD